LSAWKSAGVANRFFVRGLVIMLFGAPIASFTHVDVSPLCFPDVKQGLPIAGDLLPQPLPRPIFTGKSPLQKVG
jgi:hypothetical protein